MRTRIISLVMVLALVFTLLPVYAIADAVSVTGNDDTTDSQSIDIQDIVGKIQALIKGGDPNGELENLLKGLNIDTIVQILEKLGLDSDTAKQLLEKLKDMDMKTLYETLKKLLEDGSFNSKDIIDILKYLFGDSNGNIPTDKIIDILKGLIGGDGNIDTDKIIDILKGLIGGDGNIDTDKIIDILKGLIGGDGNIDTDKIIEILKGLIGGDGDIGGILGQLDAYTLLKAIAGLIGSKLDVTGPKDVTVNEGETATFNVKVNSKASGLKYMWIEPSVVKGLDLGGIDFSGSKLEIAMKLFQALSKVSLSTTDTLELKNTAAADNGRTFACVIYNIALKDITLFVTDEAKLTVTPVVPCQHVKVIDTPAIAATCTTDGRTEGSHCSVCNEVLSVSEVIKATGHDFSDLDGIRCKNCGEYVPFPFTDVPKTAWYRADVEYVWQHGIMKGISATKFGPDTKMTRAMFVTVLYRMEGSPSVEGMQIPAFTDIGAKWCYDAIIWAYNAGVTLGKTATTFAPNDSITRAEIVTMVYRYSGSPTVSGVPNFTDAASVGAWARDAIIWATSVGVVNGYTDGSFGPNKTALRSEMAAMLHRYMEFVKAF
ncbi:MAG: S-layer homology domain-containing protein [Firmicutes bacterium]|nr:S-layer homology domain-containing protein [Bacillota bacterium]